MYDPGTGNRMRIQPDSDPDKFKHLNVLYKNVFLSNSAGPSLLCVTVSCPLRKMPINDAHLIRGGG